MEREQGSGNRVCGCHMVSSRKTGPEGGADSGSEPHCPTVQTAPGSRDAVLTHGLVAREYRHAVCSWFRCAQQPGSYKPPHSWDASAWAPGWQLFDVHSHMFSLLCVCSGRNIQLQLPPCLTNPLLLTPPHSPASRPRCTQASLPHGELTFGPLGILWSGSSVRMTQSPRRS